MIKTHHHVCSGTCSRSIDITYDDQTKIIEDINVVGGCNGNLKGIKALVKNRTLKEVHDSLRNITCGPRVTSCPDQLAIAIEEIENNK